MITSTLRVDAWSHLLSAQRSRDYIAKWKWKFVAELFATISFESARFLFKIQTDTKQLNVSRSARTLLENPLST